MSLPPGAYRVAITNVARFIASDRNAASGTFLDAFAASTTLAIAFCKSKEEVVSDILRVTLPADPDEPMGTP